MKLLLLLQNVDIEEKVKNAPNSNYEIGLAIGSYLPFVLLILIAYYFYYKASKKNKEKNLEQ